MDGFITYRASVICLSYMFFSQAYGGSDGLDDLLRFADAFVNDNGQLSYQGRTIHYKTKGRVHSFSEPWVFDATAWDVESGTSVKVKHFDESEDAAKNAVQKLILELKQKGIIKEAVPNESETSDQNSSPKPPPGTRNKDDKDITSDQNNRDPPHDQEPRQLQPDGNPDDIHGKLEDGDNSEERIPTEEAALLWYLRAFVDNQFALGVVSTALIGFGIVAMIQCTTQTQTEETKPNSDEADRWKNETPITHVRKPAQGMTVLDELEEVEPDDGGLYTTRHVKAAKPTPENLRGIDHYSMWSPVKGFAYILNNSEFPQRPEPNRRRNGSQIDFANMKHLFTELGYKIEPHENLESTDIRETIKSFVAKFNEVDADYSSAVVVLMSHGDTGYIRGTDERDVWLKEIQAEFEGNKCPKLQGKPKLFFIQACRGKLITTTSSSEADTVAHDSSCHKSPSTENSEADLATDDNFAKDVPDNADMHFAYATTEGYLSLRSKVEGSWFIQVITEVFLANAHNESLDNLMNKVTNRVSALKGKLYDPETDTKVVAKQTPERVTRMRKTFYFLPKYPPTY